jgi:hypothetical protein
VEVKPFYLSTDQWSFTWFYGVLKTCRTMEVMISSGQVVVKALVKKAKATK